MTDSDKMDQALSYTDKHTKNGESLVNLVMDKGLNICDVSLGLIGWRECH